MKNQLITIIKEAVFFGEKRTEPRDFENRIKEQIQNSYKKSFTIPTSVERNDK